MSFIAAYDIGGTKIELSIFEFSQKGTSEISFLHKSNEVFIEKVASKRFPTARQNGLKSVLIEIQKNTNDLFNEAKLDISKIEIIGVGLPGTVDPKSSTQLMGNSQIFTGVDISKELQLIYPQAKHISIANDANCFAYAEAKCGPGKRLDQKNSSLIGIILGTGVGGGLVQNGKMLEGKSGGCAEIGHTVFSPSAPMCYCGQKGCVEQVLSGPALEASFNSRRYSQIPEFQSAKQIFELSKKLDPIAKACLNQYQKDLASFLTNLTNFFDPDMIVLGGGLSAQDEIYQELENKITAQRFVPTPSPAILKNQLGDSAGIIGAAVLAFERSNEIV